MFYFLYSLLPLYWPAAENELGGESQFQRWINRWIICRFLYFWEEKVTKPALSVINLKHCTEPYYTGKVIYLEYIYHQIRKQLSFFQTWRPCKQSQINLFMLCLVRNHSAICLHATQHRPFFDNSGRQDLVTVTTQIQTEAPSGPVSRAQQ